MGEIHVHEFMSLDGVVDAPTWTFDYGFDPQMGEAIGAVTARSRGILLGARRTRCSSRRGRREPWRTMPGRRSSTTRRSTSSRARWRPQHGGTRRSSGRTTPDAIRRLKDKVDGDLYVSGSVTLVQGMLADGLHLFVYPLTRGSGPRLFRDEAVPSRFSLAASDSYANGVVYLAYRPQGL
jgi:dihydrofolate reductase